ncbi:MAG: SprT family zinc-dependent metalloprotease [Longimicrobiales bacterium]
MRTPEDVLDEMHARGATRLRAVRLKENRSTLLSLSRDGRTLHAHRCFAAAPAHVLDDIAAWATLRPRTAAHREVTRRVVSWPTARVALGGLRRAAANGRSHANGNVRRNGNDRGHGDVRGGEAIGRNGNGNGRGHGTGETLATRAGFNGSAQRDRLLELYRFANRTRFGGRLPARVPIRLSRRMRRSHGQVVFLTSPDGKRSVIEIALNDALMDRGNERDLMDTLLHEMAHIEAFLYHGHSAHGPVWKRIARRVGCEDRACADRRPRRRRKKLGDDASEQMWLFAGSRRRG